MNKIKANTYKYIFLFSVLLIVLVFISLQFGEKILSVYQVIKALFKMDSKFNNMLVGTLRAPRVFSAVLACSCLALSGAIMQGVIKNDLASPEILGVSDAGCVGMLVFYTIFMDPKNNSLTVPIIYLPFVCFIFSLSTILFIMLFTKRNPSSFRLILIGIGISSIFKAIRNILIIHGPVVVIKEAATWLTGTIYGTNAQDTLLLCIWASVFIVLSIIFIKELNLQTFDDQMITSLGSQKNRNRYILLLISSALTSGAVAIGGGISFVGLVAPHIAKRLVGSRFENLIPVSLLIGGLIGVLSDMASKWLFYPTQVPIGVFTALFGAPYFIYLLIRSRRTSERI